MKAGCYLSLALLTGLILVYHQWLQIYVDPPEVWIAASVLGLAIWFCLGALWNAWTLAASIRALRDGLDGVTPQDGTVAAVEGEVHPYGDPIVGPMSAETCVIYEYEISRRVSSDNGSRSIIDFSGIGMAPCEIRTEHQTIALFGFPEMDEFPNQNCGYGSRDRAQEYLRTTALEDYSGLKAIQGFSEMLGALTSNRESIKRDFRMVGSSACPWLNNSRESSDDYLPSIYEKRISVGQRVLAIGKYDAATQSFGTSTGTTFQRVRLLKGPLAEALKRALSSRRSYFLGGLIGLVVVHAIAAGVLWLFCHSAETQNRWKRAYRDAIQAGDIADIDRQLDRGLDVNAPLDEDLRSALHITEDAEVAQHLLARGANPNALNLKLETPMMIAAATNRTEVLQMLISAGADLNLMGGDDHTTALVRADSIGNRQAADLLRAAGAKDEVVTAVTGTAVTDDHPAFQVCVGYVAAIHAGDLDQLRARSAISRRAMLDEVDWELWRSVRPRELKLNSGFVNESSGTIQFTGTTAAEFQSTWVLQLLLEDGEWHVLRERWITE